MLAFRFSGRSSLYRCRRRHHGPSSPLTIDRADENANRISQRTSITAGAGQAASPLVSSRAPTSVPLRSAQHSFVLPQHLDLVWHLCSHAPPTLRTTYMTAQNPEKRPDHCRMQAQDNTEQLRSLGPLHLEPTLPPQYSSAARPDR